MWRETKRNIPLDRLNDLIYKAEKYAEGLRKTPFIIEEILKVVGNVGDIQIKTTKSPQLMFSVLDADSVELIKVRHCIVHLHICKHGDLSYRAVFSYIDPNKKDVYSGWVEFSKTKPTKCFVDFKEFLLEQLVEIRRLN